MSTGFNADQLISVVQPRHITNGMNITADQDVNIPPIKPEQLIIPSSSTCTWGSYFVIDFREKNVILSNLTLQFNTSAISGKSGATCYLNPAWFWISRLELFMNGTVVDTIYPTQQFILNQFLHNDQDRLTINSQAGNYDNVTQRTTKSQTAGSDWFVNLQTIFDANNVPFYTNSHDLQIRIYMDTLANQVNNPNSETGTAVVSFNYVNLIASIIRLDESTVATQKSLMYQYPFDHLYHDLRQQIVTVNSGVSSTTVILSAIVGQVAALVFVVRNIGSTTTDSAFAFNAITSFEILNSSSTNITGGQAVSRALNLLVQGKSNCLSSYLNEIDIGGGYNGAANNNSANVFCYSFSQNLPYALKAGVLFGSYPFQGNEQLKLTFPSTLSTDIQIDVYALTECRLRQSLSTIEKLPF